METICGVIAIEMLLMAVVSSGEIVTHPHNCLQRNDTLVLHIFCIVLIHILPQS